MEILHSNWAKSVKTILLYNMCVKSLQDFYLFVYLLQNNFNLDFVHFFHAITARKALHLAKQSTVQLLEESQHNLVNNQSKNVISIRDSFLISSNSNARHKTREKCSTGQKCCTTYRNR